MGAARARRLMAEQQQQRAGPVRIRLVHVTRFDYSADVVEGVMEVRLGPLSDSTQRWDRFKLSVTPTGSVRPYADGFGNRTHLVTVGKPHSMLEV